MFNLLIYGFSFVFVFIIWEFDRMFNHAHLYKDDILNLDSEFRVNTYLHSKFMLRMSINNSCISVYSSKKYLFFMTFKENAFFNNNKMINEQLLIFENVL